MDDLIEHKTNLLATLRRMQNLDGGSEDVINIAAAAIHFQLELALVRTRYASTTYRTRCRNHRCRVCTQFGVQWGRINWIKWKCCCRMDIFYFASHSLREVMNPVYGFCDTLTDILKRVQTIFFVDFNYFVYYSRFSPNKLQPWIRRDADNRYVQTCSGGQSKSNRISSRSSKPRANRRQRRLLCETSGLAFPERIRSSEYKDLSSGYAASY